jgi:PilZ domain-containing protein
MPLIAVNALQASGRRFDQFFEINATYACPHTVISLVRQAMMQERRQSPRHRVFKAGTIEFNRAGGVSCTVRNVSSGGACLEVESPLGIPETFGLLITGDPVLHQCHIAWRSPHRIGVAFA